MSYPSPDCVHNVATSFCVLARCYDLNFQLWIFIQQLLNSTVIPALLGLNPSRLRSVLILFVDVLRRKGRSSDVLIV